MKFDGGSRAGESRRHVVGGGNLDAKGASLGGEKNLRRMVLATSGPSNSSPRAATQRTTLCAIAASTAQALLAWKSPDGQCSNPE